MKTGRIVLLIVGALAALTALGLLAGGVGTLVLGAGEADGDGFLTSPSYRLSSDGYAVTTQTVDLGAAPGEWTPWVGAPDTRLTVTGGESTQELFVGIGPAADVSAYLDGVAHAEIADIGESAGDVEMLAVAGESTPAVPWEQDFWVARREGRGTQTVTWNPTGGDWTAVIMNADAQPRVAVTAAGGVAAAPLTPIGSGLVAAGLIGLAIASTMILVATGGARRTPTPAASRYAASKYPLHIEGHLDEPLNRGLWLVKWLLAIPHYIVLGFLWVASVVATVIAGFMILFTGHYPRALFDFNVGVLRWTWRVSFYAFTVGTDRYPPFTLAPADYPATLDVTYPGRLSRGLWIVKGLLAIPHLVIVGVFAGGASSWAFGDAVAENWRVAASGGLIGVLVTIAGVILLFTGRYPRGLFDFAMGMNRWVYRVMIYTGLMTDQYPPFTLDEGGEEQPPVNPEPLSPQDAGSTAEALTRA